MASIIDLTQSSVIAVDTSLPAVPKDSNINVYEFGNLILADLLPIVISMLGVVSDLTGLVSSISDISEASVSATDTTEAVQTITDSAGSSVSPIDEAVVLFDDSNINVYEFGNVLLAGLLPSLLELMSQVADMQGSTISISDQQEAVVLETDVSEVVVVLSDVQSSNSVPYEEVGITYEGSSINYDGYLLPGVMVDISGS